MPGAAWWSDAEQADRHTRRAPADDAPATQGRNLTSRRREWPHQVALSADKVRGAEHIVHDFADARSAARRTCLMRRDDRFVVFCFARREDAEAFCQRVGGVHLATPSPARRETRLPFTLLPHSKANVTGYSRAVGLGV
jgi:hypothetical protein